MGKSSIGSVQAGIDAGKRKRESNGNKRTAMIFSPTNETHFAAGLLGNSHPHAALKLITAGKDKISCWVKRAGYNVLGSSAEQYPYRNFLRDHVFGLNHVRIAVVVH